MDFIGNPAAGAPTVALAHQAIEEQRVRPWAIISEWLAV
jgi:hypothetical protein